MQAGTGGFTHGKQSAQVGAPSQIGDHSTAGVVGRRHHGDGLFGDVDTQLQATLQDVGKVLFQKLRALVRNIQVHAVQAVLLHLKVNGAGDHVAWGQLGPQIVRRHKARAAGAGG